MSELISIGKCLYCEQMFDKKSIHRHFQKHFTEKTKTSKPGKSFLVKAETNPKWGSTPYFLSLWIDGETSFDEIDDFLRRIWLECCGHMSSFTNPKNKRGKGLWNFFEAEEMLAKGKTKDYEKMMEEANGEIPMGRKAKDVFIKSLKIDYDYDFGSTTSLQLTVINEYPIKADNSIVLLSRNEPLEILCSSCGKEPAVNICSVCIYDEESSFCKKCGTKHAKTCSDFDDYAAMPIVNSPRMGVCAYDGGSIDKERDGIYKKR